MSRIPALVVCIFVGACSEPTLQVGVARDAGSSIDGGDMDAAHLDASAVVDAPPVNRDAPRTCMNREVCRTTEVCLGGICQPDPCFSANLCGDAGSCQARCVATSDPCAGVTCGGTETCIDGRCVAGCFPVTCRGVVCESGQYCDRTSSRCVPIRACTGACGTNQACHQVCIPPNPCDNVRCTANQFCSDGRCIDDPCAAVNCAPGEACENGVCRPTCNCEPACVGASTRCVFGRCVCTPDCTGKMCGAADGCGGRCSGPCADTRQMCDSTTRMCVCRPNCPATAMCGADDTCGGRCMGTCAPGQMCDGTTRACVCAPALTMDAATVMCGTTIPNRCPGGPTGTGTLCTAANTRCNGTICACVPAPTMDPNTVACGTDIPDRCPGSPATKGRLCATGSTCNGTTCVCDQACSMDPGSVACGTNNIPNRCSGGPACSGTMCASGFSCTGGSCACVPACSMDPGSVACGTNNIANRCSGQAACSGTMCPAGSTCMGGSCVCTPRCSADENATACGTPIANACSGGPGCTGRMCPAGQRCNGTSCCSTMCPASLACGVTGVTNGCGDACTGTTCPTNQTCMGGRCVCQPNCMPTTGACGASNGCGLECSGRCDRGFTCSRETGTTEDRFECVPESCPSPCTCGDICVQGACVQRCAPEALCGCNRCCDLSREYCDVATSTCRTIS